MARYSGVGDKNYYLASLTRDAAGNVTARLLRNVNGVVTELAVVEDALPNVGAIVTGALRFRIVGTTLQLFLDGNLLATSVDATFKSGSFGIRSTGGASLDDFQVWPITTGADNFDLFTKPDYMTLSDPWSQPVGFFQTIGNKIQGSQGLNLAVLNAVNQADVDVQASFNLTGLNHTAGLIARYQGSGDANYYLANLTRTSTGFTVALRRNINGTVTTLRTTNILSSTGKVHLRFLVTGINHRVFVNNILVINSLETSLASGSVGIRTDAYSTVDDFRAIAATTQLPFTDNFNRPDGQGLGTDWTLRVGDFSVVGNKVTKFSGSPGANLATLIGVQQANVELQADVTLVATNDEVGLVAGQSGTTADANYYLARVVKTAAGFNLSIVKNVSGAVTVLQQTDVLALTGPIKFRLEGAILKLFMNNVLMLSRPDSSFAAGNVGIRMLGTATIDNFSATPVNFLPYTDSFDPNTLNSNWGTRAGGYTTTAVADKAKGTQALNLLTLGRFNATDVDVQADINVPAVAGQFAGVVARYTGSGDNNWYQAAITYDGTQYVASIAKKVGGVTTSLASVNVGTGIGTLRFTVIGGQLKLYFGGTEQLSVYDFSLKSGSVGIRSSLDPTFDNFSAKQAS